MSRLAAFAPPRDRRAGRGRGPMTAGRALCLGWLVTAGASAAPAQSPFAWQAATPESQGMSREMLDAHRAALAARKTTAFLVVRNDKIVYEWYADGFGPAKPHGTASLAKAAVGGLALAVAVTDGRIALSDPVARYVPQWASDPRKARIRSEERRVGKECSDGG